MVKHKSNDQTLAQIYNHIKSPYGLSNPAKLSQASKLPKSRIEQFLASNRTYTLHKPARKNYVRRTVLAREPGYQWQSDIIILKRFSKHNKGYGYLLSVIDIYSRFGFIKPMKRKSGLETTQNFEEILEAADKTPKHLQTDEDRAYLGKNFQKLLRQYNIKHFFTKSELKASLVERFNKTIVTKIYKLMTLRHSFRYIDQLKNIVYAYNYSFHRSIGMAPIEVNKKTKRKIWMKLHSINVNPPKKPKFRVGDTVRISKYKKLFRKSYLPQFSEELFTVSHINHGIPITYSLSDLNGKSVQGVFYTEELTAFPINKDTEFLIDKILKKRKDSVFVSWKNYGPEFNSWVKKSELKKLKTK